MKSRVPRKLFLWKKLRFSGCPGAKVRRQRPLGAVRAQTCSLFLARKLWVIKSLWCFVGKYDQNDGNPIEFVHRQVHKNIFLRSLTGFITIINLKVGKPFICYFFPYLAKVLFIKWHSNWVISDAFVKLCTRQRFICNYDWNHKVFILVNTIIAIIAFYPILIWTKWTLLCVTMWKIGIDCPKIKIIIVN